MIDHTHDSDCAAFDARLADYLEYALPAEARASADAHLAGCVRCQALVSDLRAIVRDAAALGPIEPARDLWAGIAARIEAPVVPIGRTGEHALPTVTRLKLNDTTSRRFLVSKRWLAAAASVLVAASVGGTYAVMRVADGTQTNGTPLVASVASVTPAPVPTTTPAPSGPAAGGPAAAVPNAAPARLASTQTDALAPAVQTYDREIATLRRALDRRDDLDSATVAVVEQNLTIIDDAIAACRRALARDPNSRLLGDQLTRTLDQKVELLRTAVLLPART